MKVLVTGGAGFIGSHIADLLVEEGHQVIIVDNLVTGDQKFVPPNVKMYILDILDKRLGDIFLAEKPEVIIHQAAHVHVPTSLKDPLYDARVNTLGTLNILEFARRNNIQKIIYASSCAAYGEPTANLVKESDKKEPVSPYGTSKWLSEHYLKLYHRIYQLDYTILRYANVYGPRQGQKGEGGVVSIFLQNMLNGKPPTIYGNGKQTRDFVYVKDVARANLLALNEGSKQVLNISTGIATSVNELYQTVNILTGKKLVAEYQEKRAGDIEHISLDPSLAKIHLKWEPQYTLNKGLLETIR